ncbi:MAG: PilZ domain-containing protein [Pseudomonadota bacterium]
MAEHTQLERRKVPRFPQRNVFGSITFGKRRSAISCLVRDLSRAGAKIWTLAVRIIPETFVLTLDETGEVAECHVIWRSETEIGVVFESTAPF